MEKPFRDGKPATPKDAFGLYHHGVKGMKWGIRKKDPTSGLDTGSKSEESTGDNRYKNAIPPATAKNKQEQHRMMIQDYEKSIAKTEHDGPGKPEGSLIGDHKKAIAYAAVGALVVGYSVYQLNQPATKFSMKCTASKLNSWGGQGYVKPSSFDRPAFELPAGHTFHRLSMSSSESGFSGATYSTHNATDLDRYISEFRKEKGGAPLHHVTFTSKGPVKIPDLNTTLDSLREVMESSGWKPEPEQVISQYNSLSGGSWGGTTAKALFKNLSAKGYHGIVDEMDAGVIGDTPLVIFDHKNMNKKQTTPLTDAMIKSAQKRVKVITKPPRK